LLPKHAGDPNEGVVVRDHECTGVKEDMVVRAEADDVLDYVWAIVGGA
jgi:hypothetical protein